MSSGYKWKAGLFSGEGGVLRWRKYAIFSYFLCGTLGIWKKACPFIRGTKGSGQGHVGLEVNISQCFSQSWRRWRSPSPQLFMLMLPVYGALPIRGARCWRLRPVHSSSCWPLRSCMPICLLGMCANWGWGWEGTRPSSELGDSGTEVNWFVFISKGQASNRDPTWPAFVPRSLPWPDWLVNLLGVYRCHLLVGIREVSQRIPFSRNHSNYLTSKPTLFSKGCILNIHSFWLHIRCPWKSLEWVFVWLFPVRHVVPMRTVGVSRNSKLFLYTDILVGAIHSFLLWKT